MLALGIRGRVVLLAVLPACIAVFILALVLVNERLEGDRAHLAQSGSVIARQLATGSEYGLFAGDIDYLDSTLSGALREDNLVGALIRDAEGRVVISGGELSAAREQISLSALPEGLEWQAQRLYVTRHVRRGGIPLDDLYSLGVQGEQQTIGVVVISLSLDDLHRQSDQIVAYTSLVAALAALFAAVIAMRVGRTVTGPLARIGRALEQIGDGVLDARVAPEGGDDLRRLGEGVNLMAERLALARDNLQHQIDEATKELNAKKQGAELANAAKSRFLAAASHDLRQPLHALGLFADQLAQHKLEGEAGVLARQINEASESLAGLLDSLLDISRIDAGAMVPNRRRFPLARLFDRIAIDFTETAQNKGIRLRVRPTQVWVESDPALLERILLNLVSNAIRYTEHGTVLLAARHRNGVLCIEVRDSGLGIDKDAQSLIFAEFVQIGNPERDQRKGLGLGLAIVARLTGLLEHRLELRSGLGKGSTFWLEVPEVAPPLVDEKPEPSSLSTLEGRIILLVEDDDAIRKGMSEQLSAWGCVVHSARSGDELIRKINREKIYPDAIVRDHQLSEGERGIDLVERVRYMIGRALPGIVVSGDTQTDTLALARSQGLPLLIKPVRPAKLRAALESLLQR